MDLLIGDDDSEIAVVYETIAERFFPGWWRNSILARGYWQRPSEAAKQVYEGLVKKRVKDALKNTPITPEKAQRVKDYWDCRRREQEKEDIARHRREWEEEDKGHPRPGCVPVREGGAWVFNVEDPRFNSPATRKRIERLRKEGQNVEFVGDPVCVDGFLM